MAPKQDSNSERITAVESQLGGLTGLTEKICAETKTNNQRLLEMEKRAEERHLQSMTSKPTSVV